MDNGSASAWLSLAALAVGFGIPTSRSTSATSYTSVGRAALAFGAASSAPDAALFRFRPRFFMPIAAPSVSGAALATFLA
jgi:hypothetical protein